MLADLDSRDGGGNRFELAANFRRRIHFEIENILMRRLAKLRFRRTGQLTALAWAMPISTLMRGSKFNSRRSDFFSRRGVICAKKAARRTRSELEGGSVKIIQKLKVQKGFMSRWDRFLRVAIGFCVVCAAAHAAASIVINEIHYNPDLNNEGERIVLRNAAGGIENEVDYQQGFPWPTVGNSPGYSIELVNPSFDNNLGANWRASVAGNPTQQSQTLIPDHSIWKYFKGLSEASSPTTAWRALDFDEAGWLTGPAPI